MDVKQMIIVFIVLLVVGIFIAWGPPDAIERTSTPEYCASCHVMESHHEHWQGTAKHRHLKCVDCHLPNNNAVNHLVWKGIDGVKDLVMFHSGWYSEPIELSAHGREAVQGNCLRCHGHLTTHVPQQGDRTCWSCHRRVSHRVVPLQTREIPPAQTFHTK
jgi:cytochrome c nitrite reductase small subunit